MVAITESGLLDRARDKAELNEGILDARGRKTSPSLVFTIPSSVRTRGHWLELRTKKWK